LPIRAGAFREVLVADAAQRAPADGLTPGEAAMPNLWRSAVMPRGEPGRCWAKPCS
jgi:hypothetical protein